MAKYHISFFGPQTFNVKLKCQCVWHEEGGGNNRFVKLEIY